MPTQVVASAAQTRRRRSALRLFSLGKRVVGYTGLLLVLVVLWNEFQLLLGINKTNNKFGSAVIVAPLRTTSSSTGGLVAETRHQQEVMWQQPSSEVAPWWHNWTKSMGMSAAAKMRWQNNCRNEPFIDPADWKESSPTQHRPGELILILQYGKCGSSAMEAFLNKTAKEINNTTNHQQTVIHTHNDGKADTDKGHTELVQRLKNNETVWIVTMVRNRFVRDASSLFENHIEYKVTPRMRLVPDLFEKMQQVWFSQQPRISNHWFTDRFQSWIGVDLPGKYASAFNMSKRSLLVQEGNYRILLLRYEDIRYWEKIMHHYFPHSKRVGFRHVRVTAGNWLATRYSQVVAHMPYTQQQIEYIVHNSETSRFYTDCERRAMAWSAANPLPLDWKEQRLQVH